MLYDPNLFSLDSLLTLITLTGLEVVLGIDNVVFIALLSSRLPRSLQSKARVGGLALALVLRVIMLYFASWIAQLNDPWVEVSGLIITGRMALFLGGGIFLILKGLKELHTMFGMKEEPNEATKTPGSNKRSFAAIIAQIALIDLVLSFDSIITAVGLTSHIEIIAVAIMIAIIVMLLLAGPVARFIQHTPSIKVIAIAIIMLIGAYLTAQGLDYKVSKSYINAAIFFSVAVEVCNIAYRRKYYLTYGKHVS